MSSKGEGSGNNQKTDKQRLLPKLRFPGFQKARQWERAKLEDVAELVGERTAAQRLTVANYVSTENLLPDYGGVVKANRLPTVGSVTRFRTNDILVSNIRPYLKKIWFSTREGGASNDVLIIRAGEQLLPEFLSCVLRGEYFIAYVMQGAKGVKMPRGDIPQIRAFPLSYPSRQEQVTIADCLSSIDELIAAEARKLDVLKTYKKGLLQQLFPAEGETQDEAP